MHHPVWERVAALCEQLSHWPRLAEAFGEGAGRAELAELLELVASPAGPEPARVSGLMDAVEEALVRLGLGSLATRTGSYIAAARSDYAGSARLAAWGVLYAALAGAWWPAAFIGSALMTIGAVRARPIADSLVDTAVDLHLADLAEHLKIPSTENIGLTGKTISTHLRS